MADGGGMLDHRQQLLPQSSNNRSNKPIISQQQSERPAADSGWATHGITSHACRPSPNADCPESIHYCAIAATQYHIDYSEIIHRRPRCSEKAFCTHNAAVNTVRPAARNTQLCTQEWNIPSEMFSHYKTIKVEDEQQQISSKMALQRTGSLAQVGYSRVVRGVTTLQIGKNPSTFSWFFHTKLQTTYQTRNVGQCPKWWPTCRIVQCYKVWL